jgi:predicted CxxxxCH...CXXCH cytochrome family protein
MPVGPILGDTKIQIGFSAAGFTGRDTTYDGGVLNSPYSYEGTNGTAITYGGTDRCSNLYCHSDGTALSTGVINANITPPWSSATGTFETLPCNTCHGFPPTYAQDAPKANSHLIHGAITTCDMCHYTTTSDGVHVTNSELNSDGKYDVVPNSTKIFSWSGRTTSVNFNYVFDVGGGTCMNNSCHLLRGASEAQGQIWGGVRPWITSGASCQNTGLEYGQERCTVSGVGGATPPYTYRWEFGDGTVDTAPTPTHIFKPGESLNVKLTVRDANRHALSIFAAAQPPTTPPPTGPGGCTPGVYVPPVVVDTITLRGSTFPATVSVTDTSYICSAYYPGGIPEPVSSFIRISWGDSGNYDMYPMYENDAQPRYYSHTYYGHSFWDFGRHFSICITVSDAAGAVTYKCYDAGI